MQNALHFVGFKDDRIHNAIKTFGQPDFYHRIWDGRAKSMIIDGDVAVFADGDENDTPQMFSFDDSQMW
jgi:hypothetical protein